MNGYELFTCQQRHKVKVIQSHEFSCLPVTEASTEWFFPSGSFLSSCAICDKQCESMATEKWPAQ